MNCFWNYFNRKDYMIIQLAEIKENDKIIIPAGTFTSSLIATILFKKRMKDD